MQRRHSGATPTALVGSLSGKFRRSNGSGSLTSSRVVETARHLPDNAKKVIAGPLPKGLAKRLPPRRKRKSIARRLPGDMRRIAKIASGFGTAVGVAATAAELLTAVRQQLDAQPTQQRGRGGESHGPSRSQAQQPSRSEWRQPSRSESPDHGVAERVQKRQGATTGPRKSAGISKAAGPRKSSGARKSASSAKAATTRKATGSRKSASTNGTARKRRGATVKATRAGSANGTGRKRQGAAASGNGASGSRRANTAAKSARPKKSTAATEGLRRAS